MNGISVQNGMMEETGTKDTETPTTDTEPSTKDTATENTEVATEITETLKCTTDTDTSKTETLTNDTKKITKHTETDTKDTETVIKDTESDTKDTETVIKDTESDTKDTETVIKDTETEPKSVIKEPEIVIKDPKTADSETESETDTSETETDTPWANPDTSSSNSGSRKKNQISNCEILAQMKNRHEEIILNSRLKSLHSKQCHEEYSLARTKKQLIETMKRSKRTSGLSQNTFVPDESVTPVIYKYYQTPWAYSFNDTTHNSLYKEIEQLPKRSFKRKGRQTTTRPKVKSAPSNQRTVPSLIDRSISASNVELNGNSNETLPLLRARRTPIMRPHSCMFPMQAKDRGNVDFHQDTVRPHTSKHDSIMTHRRVERKQSWIKPINRSNSNPITDTRPEEDNNEMTDDEFVSKYLGNSDKVNRYRYLNRKNGSSQVEYRGQKLKNYIRPQDRYKKDPLNLIRREKMVLKLSMTDSESLEESRNTALKAGEAFPKAARLRMLNELIASNNDRSRGPYVDYNAELQARIEHFLRSIDEFSESRSTGSYETKTGSVHS